MITEIALAAKKKENKMKTKILFFIIITILSLAIYSPTGTGEDNAYAISNPCCDNCRNIHCGGGQQ